jgi:hypothetical protein
MVPNHKIRDMTNVLIEQRRQVVKMYQDMKNAEARGQLISLKLDRSARALGLRDAGIELTEEQQSLIDDDTVASMHSELRSAYMTKRCIQKSLRAIFNTSDDYVIAERVNDYIKLLNKIDTPAPVEALKISQPEFIDQGFKKLYAVFAVFVIGFTSYIILSTL